MKVPTAARATRMASIWLLLSVLFVPWSFIYNSQDRGQEGGIGPLRTS